jgi:Spy/CpxP family protein refolding chaperone
MKNILRILPAALGVFFLVHAAWGQVPLKDLPAGKWWTNRRIIQELRLTPAQQARIEAVWLRSRRILNERKMELERRQAELATLLGKVPIDEAAAVRAFAEFQQVRLSVERGTFLMRIQIKNLLSAEQQPKIEAIAERLRQAKPGAGPILPARNAESPDKK